MVKVRLAESLAKQVRVGFQHKVLEHGQIFGFRQGRYHETKMMLGNPKGIVNVLKKGRQAFVGQQVGQKILHGGIQDHHPS